MKLIFVVFIFAITIPFSSVGRWLLHNVYLIYYSIIQRIFQLLDVKEVEMIKPGYMHNSQSVLYLIGNP